MKEMMSELCNDNEIEYNLLLEWSMSHMAIPIKGSINKVVRALIRKDTEELRPFFEKELQNQVAQVSEEYNREFH